jgi:hypothetical protein
LSGFYLLGRSLDLSRFLSLLLAYLSGLYVPSALVTSWTGIGLEMASARNLYLALLPWLCLIALYLYRQRTRLRGWGFFGLVLGGLANLHPVDGIVTICIFGILTLIAVLLRKLSWSRPLAFCICALPGLVLIYLTIYAPYSAIADFPQGFHYDNLTRANVFFYRLPNFINPITLFTLLTLGTGVGWLRSRSGRFWGIAFGAAQFFGALLLLPQDWLVLLAFVLWVQGHLWRSRRLYHIVPLLSLCAVNMLALSVGLVFWLMNTHLDI